MKCPKKFSIVPIILFLFINPAFAQQKTFEDWKKGRIEELTAEDGWLNLVGLFWIDNENFYLNEVSDSLEVSDRAGKKNIGTFQFLNDSVWFFFNPRLGKKLVKQAPAKTLVYPLEYGKGGGAYYNHWKWTVIQRGGNYGVRMRDLAHPQVKSLIELPYYDYNPDFKVQAFFEPKFNETMNIPNVLGQNVEWNVMGILKFEMNGISHELTVLDELGKFFVIFSDETNGEETYPSGRYLYASFPDKTGMTSIDFNYAYNPPCAFTEFATCPIPPKENRLKIAIEAGEKYSH